MNILSVIPINYYLLLSAVLFCIGVLGVMFRRNAIIIFMCIELMLNAVNLLLTAFSTQHGNADGQVFVFFIMAVAAAEVAVGLAILVMIYRNIKSVDIDMLNKIKW
jgi:NADH-quinone oxidoreductase subunit K